MRQQLSSFAVVAGMLALACATATEDGALAGNFGIDDGGSGGNLNVAGSMVNGTSGSITTAGSTNMTTGGTATGGSTSTGGTTPNAFGGSATTGGKPSGGSGGTTGGSGGKASGGSGGSSGGKGGTGGTSGSGGTGGKPAGGSGGGGTGSGGTTSATCNGVADWTNTKTYAVGDNVANTCTGVFAGSCAMGQHHKFECNPPAGSGAVGWCKDREPGAGNGWQEAWVDKGQCQ